MKKIFFLIVLSSISFNTFGDPTITQRAASSFPPIISQEDFLNFCQQNPKNVYQDIFVHGKVLFQGANICDVRYDIIKTILQRYKNYFSVLDIGAAQGYFSFRIGTEFPKSQCIMIEHHNNNYSYHQDMLYQLCQMNSDLKNVTYLQKRLSVEALEDLNSREHFDVVIALLVVHQINPSMSVKIKSLETLLKLGDNVIIEVADNVAPELWPYVRDELSKNNTHDCTFLGEVDRFYDNKGKGEFYLFTKKHQDTHAYYHKYPQHIKPSTFSAMNGVHQYGYTYPIPQSGE